MKPVSNETIVRQLNWRYATKKFDPARPISPADWDTLKRSLVLTPSSFGLQPWRFFVVGDSAQRLQLREAAWNQSQVVDASHFVVMAIKKNLGVAEVDRFVQRIVEVRGVPAESLKGYRDIMAGFVSRPREQFNVDEWATRQVYIAMGQFMTVAAMLGVDTCPMEGLDPDRFDQILDLPAKGYATVCAVALGHRAADDKHAHAKKVRFETHDIVVDL